MGIREKIRAYDKFAAQVHLMHEGETSSGTLCGGFVSVCLNALMLAFFCMRTLDVTSFSDPEISGYTINEDRSKMDAPINYGDYG